LEQGALELPATRGAVGIDATPAGLERSARLREFPFAPSDCRLRVFETGMPSDSSLFASSPGWSSTSLKMTPLQQ
jgi:hypothetical protein